MRTPKRAAQWFPGYLRSRLARLVNRIPSEASVDVLFTIADHFEPNNRQADARTQMARMTRWAREYPRLADRFRDTDGHPPRHTFFFPAEIYDSKLMAPLVDLCAAGVAEVEVHLHHDRDTSDNLRQTLVRFTRTLHEQHGLLSCGPDGRLAYAFVHGNWALDNSLDGGRFCGVNDELTVLRETGCYADLTMPTVPHESQARTVNAVYFAIDDPARPRSHDRGPRATVGRTPPADGLLMLPGPLMLNWNARVGWLLPRVDTGAIDDHTWPTIERFARWTAAGICVRGRPEWIIVKLHTHGAPERNADVLLGRPMEEFHAELGRWCNSSRCRLHYLTARELVNIVYAAIDGHSGNPGQFRDYRYKRQA